jgi:hypothetical protein
MILMPSSFSLQSVYANEVFPLIAPSFDKTFSLYDGSRLVFCGHTDSALLIATILLEYACQPHSEERVWVMDQEFGLLQPTKLHLEFIFPWSVTFFYEENLLGLPFLREDLGFDTVAPVFWARDKMLTTPADSRFPEFYSIMAEFEKSLKGFERHSIQSRSFLTFHKPMVILGSSIPAAVNLALSLSEVANSSTQIVQVSPQVSFVKLEMFDDYKTASLSEMASRIRI